MRLTILDYGAGNLHSLAKAFTAVADVRLEPDVAAALDTDVLVLPGVGAFGLAATGLALHRASIRTAIADGLPLIGVCLGMQLLFEGSDEAAGTGLGVFAGRVVRLNEPRVPQMGWNAVCGTGDPHLTTARLATAYYANSYVCRPDGDAKGQVTAWSTYGDTRFPAVIRAGRVVGMQFHPEKSSSPGLAYLNAVLQDVTG